MLRCPRSVWTRHFPPDFNAVSIPSPAPLCPPLSVSTSAGGELKKPTRLVCVCGVCVCMSACVCSCVRDYSFFFSNNNNRCTV